MSDVLINTIVGLSAFAAAVFLFSIVYAAHKLIGIKRRKVKLELMLKNDLLHMIADFQISFSAMCAAVCEMYGISFDGFKADERKSRGIKEKMDAETDAEYLTYSERAKVIDFVPKDFKE
ncbi:MAG: hypothetical protein LBL66_08385 [Clostridiales bacterium]|nr:hypothetical protein [Clostridiales bacterium]